MKYSYSWLKELSKTKLSPEKLANLISMRAFEFEEIKDFSAGFENIVVGKIIDIQKHPNADRLQLVKVDIGKKKLAIVCGAPNISVSDKVPVALVGAKLPNGLVIKEAEIRGAKSQGMLCSPKEMGLGESHEGIMILEKNARSGQKFAAYLGHDDFQLEFAILPNRGHDALSHIGMAREIAAVEGRKFTRTLNVRVGGKAQGGLKVEIKDKNLCKRYIGALIEGIQIAPSPQWMQSKLKVCGIRPINNIVDITNYVMLELGQPMHAFDSAKLKTQSAKPNIVVRKAKKGEKIILLDEKEYILRENDLVIADSDKALALAGVMGGMDSAVSENTTSIILESANFEATNIRKTRTFHNLNTESSHRFEREIDPNLAEIAAERAIELIKEICGKEAAVKAYADQYPRKIKPWTVKLDPVRVNSLLGENIPVSKMRNILENLEIKTKISGKTIICTIPTRRIDLKTQEDLIEEIGRIFGYENIKEQAPSVTLVSPRRNVERDFENKLREAASGIGFSEVMNYSFYGTEDIEKCDLELEKHYEVSNPMNPDQQYMRRALIPGILKNIRLNLKNFEKFQIFEIGRKYRDIGKSQPEEISVLAGVFVDIENEVPFFSLKGKLDALLENIGIKEDTKYKIQNTRYKVWHPGRVAEIFINGEKVGKIGEISPIVCKRYGINQRVAYFGINIEKLFKALPKGKVFQSISKFPTVKRDISMFVPENVKYAEIEREVRKAGGELVKNIEWFDKFKDSLAVRIEIGSNEKTLTAEEIDGVMERVIGKLEKDLKVKVRK